ncbi:hypothetical protein CBL_09149 [Carabus blaptoides fortunei]
MERITVNVEVSAKFALLGFSVVVPPGLSDEPEFSVDDSVPEELELSVDDPVPEELELSVDDSVPEELELSKNRFQTRNVITEIINVPNENGDSQWAALHSSSWHNEQ